MRFILLSMAMMGLVVVEPLQAQDKDTKLGGKTLLAWVKEISSRDPSVAQKAMRAVMAFESDNQSDNQVKRAVGPALISRLDANKYYNHDTAIRVNAALAIGEMGLSSRDMQKGVTMLMRLLGDHQEIVRFHAALALGRLGTDAKAAVPKLVFALRDATWEVRKAAAWALGRVAWQKGAPGRIDVIQPLERVFVTDSSAKVRLEAITALISLGPPADLNARRKLMLDMQSLYKYRDETVAISARVAMIQLRFVPVFPPEVKAIAKFLGNSELEVRIHAAKALALLAQVSMAEAQNGAPSPLLEAVKSQIPAMIEALRDPEPDGAMAVAAALRQLKDKLTNAQVAKILKLLHDSETQVRCNAATALGMLGDRADKLVIDELIRTLDDPDASAVKAAAWALGTIGKKASPALVTLNRLTVHKDRTVRASAYEAIDRITNPVARLNNQNNGGGK